MRDMKRGKRTEDEFQTLMQKFIKLVLHHRETSIWIGLGLIVIIVGAIYFFSQGEEHKPEAELLYTQAVGLITGGRFQEAENLFIELTEKFGNTRSGKIGLYYLGVINYHTGRFVEALNFFDRFLDKVKNDYLLTPAALLGAGCAAEGLKEYERALKYYEKVTKNKESAAYFTAVLSYGRINGILGNYARAKEIFEKLLSQNPPADIASDAKFYLGYFNKQKTSAAIPLKPPY